MYEWQKQIQIFVGEIDSCTKGYHDEALMLRILSRHLGYSEFYTTRKSREISGMAFRDYVRHRKLAFALRKVRDSEKGMPNIAFDYGFSSHEASAQAFKGVYGIVPSEYRKHPRSVVLRTKLSPFDRYFLGFGEIGMMKSTDDIKICFVTIPTHKFLHTRNYKSNGYWDFWQKQSQIPGQNCETTYGLLNSIKGKLDDYGGSGPNSNGGQVMTYINDPNDCLCDQGFPRAECYDVHLPVDHAEEVPPQMQMMGVLEVKYLVFEHGPFDCEQENRNIEELVEKAMSEFGFTNTSCYYDTTSGRIIYLHRDPERFWKYTQPVRK